MKLAIVGAGRAGTALAVRWRAAGHEIVAVSGRASTPARAAAYLPGVPVHTTRETAALAEVLVLAVPDGTITQVADEVRDALDPDAWLLHIAGSVGIDALGSWPRRVAMHPLQTFPDPDGTRLTGCAAAVTADRPDGVELGITLARDAGAVPFVLREEDRPLYHAAAVFASNHVVATSWFAERLFASAGVPDPRAAMAPLQRATVDNVAAVGSAAALTGPAVRGDAATIDANLTAVEATDPEAVPVYVVLCRAIVAIAASEGRLDEAQRAAVDRVLAPWS